MRKTERTMSWVVYQMTIHGEASGTKAVCERAEWEALQRARPGYHLLVQDGITNEGEAEKLARSGTAGEHTNKRSAAKRPPRPLAQPDALTPTLSATP